MRKKTRYLCRLIPALLCFLPVTLFPQPIDMNAANAREALKDGINAYHFGYFGKAVQSFEDALRLMPTNPEVKMWLARAYFRSGFEDTALTIWKDLKAQGPEDPLLDYLIRTIDLRRGLGRELTAPEMYVVNYELDAAGPQNRLFKRPSAVVSLPDGGFFIVGYGSNEILSLDGNSLIKTRFRGNIELIDHPFDILPVENGFLVSEFEGNRITKYDRQFVKIGSFGGRGIGNGQLLGPQFLAQDEDRYIYVTDWGNRRVTKFDADGNFILSFNASAPGYPARRLEPTGIAYSQGRIFVSDRFQNQIVVFDSSGNYLDAFGAGTLLAPEGLAFFDSDTLLVADGERVMAFELRNEVWKMWSDLSGRARRIVDVCVTANQDVLAADFDGNKVYFLSDPKSLYSGFFVQIDRVDSRN
ncbi:MAG TPA: tetratricopeptide repeat protein, partial [Spirochaetia bacterium]|nr:tetratricopeptide repeat protein [Spirochaetia bacterium]